MEDDQYRYQMSFGLRHRQMKIYGVSQRFNADTFRGFIERHAHSSSPAVSFDLRMELAKTIRFEVAGNIMKWRAVDMIAPVDFTTLSLQDMLPHYAPISKSLDIIEAEPSVAELLDKIRNKQEPARVERLKKTMREQPELVVPQAQIVSITGEVLTA